MFDAFATAITLRRKGVVWNALHFCLILEMAIERFDNVVGFWMYDEVWAGAHMDMITRRRALGIAVGGIGLMGSSGALGASDASPTNPKLAYTFNPQGLVRGYPAGLSFSRSGRYLAVINSGSTFHGPALSVWDIKERSLKFRTEDLTLISAAVSRCSVVWGPDDEWIAMDEMNADGILRFLEPRTGAIVRTVSLGCSRVQFNRDCTKVLHRIGTRDFRKPVLNITNLADGVMTPISVASCETGRQNFPMLFSWTTDDRVIFIGDGVIDGNETCVPAGVDSGKPSSKGLDVLFSNHYITLIDPAGQKPRKVLQLKGQRPWSSWADINFATNRIALDNWDILDVNTMSLTPIPFSQSEHSSGESSAFSPDGRYLYVSSDDHSGRGESAVIDSQTGLQVGRFQAARHNDVVAASPDGKLLAFANDYDIQIYRLG